MHPSHSRATPSAEALALLTAHHDPAILLDGRYRILAANQAYQEDLGETGGRKGFHCYEVSHGFDRPCDQAGECCPLLAAIESGKMEQMLHVHHSSQGRELVEVQISPIQDGLGGEPCYLEVLRSTLAASAEPTPIGLVGSSPSFLQVLDLVQRVAQESVNVLLLGESGTGKELLARAIHDASPRAKMAFVPVECTVLSETLFESELFGHTKGAFTGAIQDRRGLVEEAHGGTLFLDEIGELTLALQAKLLRLLETQTFRRVGETAPRYADFRLICATNRDLSELMRHGLFRKDLYYRISAFPLQAPPLRERREDIELLANSLLLRIAGSRRLTLSRAALAALEQYSFPGNIRELLNFLECARILATGDQLLPEHFPEIQAALRVQPLPREPSDSFTLQGLVPLAELENRYLRYALAAFPGQRSELAATLGISLRSLARKIKQARAGNTTLLHG